MRDRGRQRDCSSQSLTVRVPLAIRRRGGRKVVVTPEGEAIGTSAPPRTRVDPALVKALARAHCWKQLLEEGRYASISELAKAEKIDRGYLGRILLLTLLAPDNCRSDHGWAPAGGARADAVDEAVSGGLERTAAALSTLSQVAEGTRKFVFVANLAKGSLDA
jgi:hypothetical protein